MAVAHSTDSESGLAVNLVSSFSWSHTQGVNDTHAIVAVCNSTSTSDITTGVTWDNGVDAPVSFTHQDSVSDTAGEPGRIDLYSLDSLPEYVDGNVTITVYRTNNSDLTNATCVTQTSTGTPSITGIVKEQENQVLTEENVDDGSPGTNSIRYCFMYSGINVELTPGANSTYVNGIDLGPFSYTCCVETTAGQGSRPVGFDTGATSDDVAGIYLAVKETIASSSNVGASLLMALMK